MHTTLAYLFVRFLVEYGAPIRTHERLKIQSFYGSAASSFIFKTQITLLVYNVHSLTGILHGFDSSVWLSWSKKSDRDGFMLDIPGRKPLFSFPCRLMELRGAS